MRYHIKDFNFRKNTVKHGTLKAKRKNASALSVLLPIAHSNPRVYINLDTLFELGKLPEAQCTPPKKVLIPFLKKLTRSALALFLALGTLCVNIYKSLRSDRKKRPQRVAFYFGVLCACVLVTALSAITVLAGLFAGYLAPYDELTVPSVVGEQYEQTYESLSDTYELLISYKNSDDIAAGVIMSQTPSAGVVRKMYKDRAPCTLKLTVSAGKSFYTVEELVGKNIRDALLSLHNDSVSVKQINEHSDTIPAGTVISTSPSAGHRIYGGESLTVRVSLGKKINSVRMPDLYGLSEAQAESLLASRGLHLGSITYKTSAVPAGKVIEQQFSPYTAVAEGSAINVTVSLGSSSQKYVPDLYGLTTDQARERLAEVGLVIGNIYTVSSGAPAGTVITQTPIASTPITSSITSVDIYISS